MPKCQLGNHSVPAEDLRRVGNALACSACRTLKGVEGEIPMAEEKMNKFKNVIAISVNEIERTLVDGHTKVKDHQFVADIGLGGLSLRWDVTFDQIRDFFTKRREGVVKKSTLTSV